MRVGAVISLYNREQYIGPYLKMLLSRGIDCCVALSTVPWDIGGNEEDLEPDRSEEIARSLPVKLLKDGFRSHANQLNAGISEMQDYDRIIVTDCDVFWDEETHAELLKFLEEPYAVFRVPQGTNIVEYYYDWRYGRMASPQGEPPIFAIAAGVELRNMTHANTFDIVDWESDKLLHHFRWTKANGSGKHKCVEPLTNEGFTEAPKEICDLISAAESSIFHNL